MKKPCVHVGVCRMWLPTGCGNCRQYKEDLLPALERWMLILLFKFQCLKNGQDDFEIELESKINLLDEIIHHLKKRL